MSQQLLPGKNQVIAVIGASGRLGECIIRQLHKQSANAILIGTTRKSEPTHADYTAYAPDLSERGCLTLQEQINQILSKTNGSLDMIYLVAGCAYPDDKLTPDHIKEIYTVNSDMVEWWAKQYPHVPMVFISSGAVYGTKGTIPLQCYSKAKRKGEKAFLCSTNHAPRIIVRLAQVYTDFLKRAEMVDIAFSSLIAISPEKAAQQIVRGVANGKQLILVGWATRFLHWAHNRISPSFAQLFMNL